MIDSFEKYRDCIKGRRLLILGGASQHCKLVEAAHELGVISYVSDNLIDHAPAKEMSDYAYNIDLTNIEALAALCEKERINGIASGWLDFPQIYYQRLCEKVNLPCYGTREQFDVLTRKEPFKKLCLLHGVGTPSYFPVDDIGQMEERLPYPVFVKPSDSAGSKGASVVNTKKELEEAMKTARLASNDGRAIAERFIENGRAFLAVYFFYKGRAYVQQLSDAFFGNKEDGMDRINVAYRSPFSLADKYMEIANDRVVEMLKHLGINTGPVCMQGFMTENEVLFYDPGRRFPGGEYERIVKHYTGIDMMKGMVVFALTGQWPAEALPAGEKPYLLGGKTTIRLQVNVCAGIVKAESGFDEAEHFPEVEYLAKYHGPGDEICASGSTHQRYAHVVIGADDTNELIRNVEKFYRTVDVIDRNGESMIRSKLDAKNCLGGG